MATSKGASRDANNPTQTLTIELPTEVFIKIGESIDPEFSISKTEKKVKRSNKEVSIKPIQANTSLINDFILTTVNKAASEAYNKHLAEIEAMKDKVRNALKEELRAEILSELEAEKSKGSSTKKTSK